MPSVSPIVRHARYARCDRKEFAVGADPSGRPKKYFKTAGRGNKYDKRIYNAKHIKYINIPSHNKHNRLFINGI